MIIDLPRVHRLAELRPVLDYREPPPARGEWFRRKKIGIILLLSALCWGIILTPVLLFW